MHLCSEWMNEGAESSVKGRLSSGTHVLQTGPCQHAETGTAREKEVQARLRVTSRLPYIANRQQREQKTDGC